MHSLLNLRKFLILGGICGVFSTHQSLFAAPHIAADTTKNVTVSADGYSRLPSGLEYKILKQGTGKEHPQVGYHLEMHVRVHVKDSVIFDSRQMNNDRPVPFQVQKPSFRGDFIEGLSNMVAGDSALLRLPADTVLNQNKQLMPGIKAGDILQYDVVLVSVFSESEYKIDQEQKRAKQRVIDTKVFTDYFKQHKIEALSTKTGLYYTVEKKGAGPLAKTGDIVSVNYTGRFLDGKTFDSNTDPLFHHVEPYTFPLGRGAVIKGWDEGIALFAKGGKGTLYIPSGLAYGSQGNSNIPGNTVLVFDVELVNAQSAEQYETGNIDAYITKVGVKMNKTKSGLYYYQVNKNDKAPSEKGNNTVNIRYSIANLDGRIFDSYYDTSMHHTDSRTVGMDDKSLVAGLKEALKIMKKGDRFRLVIPSKLGYADKGNKELSIKANEPLLVDIEMLDK